jgi:hypothetical protein
MKRPNITSGEWNVAHEFPGSIIAGTVEDSPRGKSAMVICRVQGNLLPTYKPNIQFIAAAPDMAKALEEIENMLAGHPESGTGNTKVHYAMHAAKAALIKAGYSF